MTDVLKRVLLAEDDPGDIELTLSALRENNLANEVIVVRDGAEVMDFLHCKGNFAMRAPGLPVVLILDIKMPKVDGIEVLAAIKGDENLKTLPIVMLTSSQEKKGLGKCYQLGANAYVVKPVVFQEFVKAIKEIGVFWALVNKPPPGSVPLRE